MLVAYASMTGNIKRFVGNLEFETVQITSGLTINRPYILITYTIGRGQVPKEVENFLDRALNKENLVGVIGSGNRNWGKNYCAGAITVASQYNVPLLHTFEMSGFDSDLAIVTSKIKELQEG
jgi:protein involved in ribonucleotide reduction